MTAQFHEGQEVEVAKAWQNCPSTHCERSQECRSPHECNGWRKAKIIGGSSSRGGATRCGATNLYVAQFPDGSRAVVGAEHIRAARSDLQDGYDDCHQCGRVP